MGIACDLLDSSGCKRPGEGATDLSHRWFNHRDAGFPRSLGPMAEAPASGAGRDLDADPDPAVVHRDLYEIGRQLFRSFGRRRHAEQGRSSPGIPWRTARPLFLTVLGDVLAGLDACGRRRTCGLARTARARRAVPAGVAGAVLDRVRTRYHQAAALRVAAVPRD